MITNNAKIDLYGLMKGDGLNGQAGSHTLPAPLFDATTTITFVNDIQTKLSITGFTIIDILGYKDYKIVYGNANNKGVIGIFDLNNNLVEAINKVDDYTGATTGTIDLDQFKTLQIDKDGFIYGLATNASKTYFIRFSDVLEQVGVLAFADVDVFYTARVDMSTQTPKDPAKPTEDIMGSTLFNDYEKIAMSDDFKEAQTYSFALWKTTSKKIHITQINVPNGSTTQDMVDWKINENIISGTGNVETDYSDISGLGIGTGNYITSSETILGSIIVETTKTSSSETWNTGSKQITKALANEIGSVKLQPARYTSNSWPGYEKTLNRTFTFDFSSAINDIKTFYNSQTIRNVSTKMKITLDSFTSGTTNSILNIDATAAATIIANNNLTVELHIVANNYEARRSNDVISEETISVKSNGVEITKINANFFYQRFYASGFNWDALSLSWNIKPSIIIDGTYEVKTTSSARATTQLLGIINGKDNGNDKYVIKQSIANIYKGSKPVFLNEIRAYAPLLARDEGQFNIYEFTPLSNTITEVEKVYLDHTPSTQTDNSPYDIPISDIASGDASKIVKVLVDSTPIASTAYERVGDIVRIKSISKDKTILITYKSNVPSPKKLLLSASTNGDDIFITGVNNKNELNTTSDDLSIVGVGDDGTNDFGFTLYSNNSNTVLNDIAEDSQAQGIGLKHIVATRQNDVLFIYGYNQDFTKEMKWISIYPQSLHPYTFLPYDDKKSEFHLERLNGADTNDVKDTLFDRAFDNVSGTGSTVIGNAAAKSTDFNYNGQATLTAYGRTNKPLFTETLSFLKTRQEERSIYINLNTNVVDKTNGEIVRQQAGDTLANIFSNKNEGHEELIQATKLKLIYTDGTSTNFDIPLEHLTIADGKLKLSTIIKREDHKLTNKLQWLNLKGDILGETTPCDYKYMQIGWEIEIKSSSSSSGGGNDGGTNPPAVSHAWDTAKWGEAIWQ